MRLELRRRGIPSLEPLPPPTLFGRACPAFDTLEKSGASTAKAAVKSLRTSDPKQAIGPGVHLLNAHTAFPVRRWDLAVDDPEIVTLIQSMIAALPRGALIADARLAVIDAVDPADVDTREQRQRQEQPDPSSCARPPVCMTSGSGSVTTEGCPR